MSNDAANEPSSIHPGTIIAERFTVDGVLGTGGAAVVYRAHDRVLDR